MQIQRLVRELKCEGPVSLHSLGTRLMALSGLSTRTVLTAEKLTFCKLREYSNILQHMEREKENMCKHNKPNTFIAITAHTAEPLWSSGTTNTENVRAILCSQLYIACITCSPALTGQVVINPLMSQITSTFLPLEMTAMHVVWQTICSHSRANWTATTTPES